jgi:hypothetical protein
VGVEVEFRCFLNLAVYGGRRSSLSTGRFTIREKAPETLEYESGLSPEPVWTHRRREVANVPMEENVL